MADSLCGPSNALQNFQKHSSADRTLQQDRLVNRQSPSQGFRSAPGAPAALDSEFAAFQAGGVPAPAHLRPHLQHFPPGVSHPTQFAPAQQAPDWASDFQRLALGPGPAGPIQHHSPQASSAATSWHQDFLQQQPPPAQQTAAQPHTMFGGIPRQTMGWSGPSYQPSSASGSAASHGYSMQHMLLEQQSRKRELIARHEGQGGMSETAQGKQRVQEGIPAFDEAAFEAAFAQAQADAFQEAEAQMREEEQTRFPVETNPTLLRLRDERQSVYAAIKLETAVQTGDPILAKQWLDTMDSLQQDGTLTSDPAEAKFCIELLQGLAQRETYMTSVVDKSDIDTLIRSINERLMSTYPLHASPVPINQEAIFRDLDATGYHRSQEAPLEQTEKEKEDLKKAHDDDEMAATAAQLLDRVADNDSEKFKNSTFLSLMRQLRDREVRVEGDKIVEVSDVQSSAPSSSPKMMPNTNMYNRDSTPHNGLGGGSSEPPPIDRDILNHAALDFDLPSMGVEDFDSAPGHDEPLRR